MNWGRGALAATVTLMTVTACGSSTLSIGGLRADATRICLRAGLQADAIQPPRAPADTAAFLKRGVAVLTPELAALRRLRPASGQAGAYSAMLAAFGRQLSLLRETAGALDRGADPLDAIKTLQERLAPAESDEAAAWRQLQIPACVSR